MHFCKQLPMLLLKLVLPILTYTGFCIWKRKEGSVKMKTG
ncbi:hypothetical protein QSI_3903 [Clostridioides difficile P28]|nr:hypothetical protein QSI_3903 [Clostridioides difficile P28]